MDQFERATHGRSTGSPHGVRGMVPRSVECLILENAISFSAQGLMLWRVDPSCGPGDAQVQPVFAILEPHPGDHAMSLL